MHAIPLFDIQEPLPVPVEGRGGVLVMTPLLRTAAGGRTSTEASWPIMGRVAG